ncbi:hypothetical protein R3P38DRAFT_1362132 [Favolaschia claudopus]|uniref:Uncharacterized protein n=1 Tax=Favolaschia claudopus TaxID=2862362 RepID=A0AAW0DSF6_9AGAR
MAPPVQAGEPTPAASTSPSLPSTVALAPELGMTPQQRAFAERSTPNSFAHSPPQLNITALSNSHPDPAHTSHSKNAQLPKSKTKSRVPKKSLIERISPAAPADIPASTTVAELLAVLKSEAHLALHRLGPRGEFPQSAIRIVRSAHGGSGEVERLVYLGNAYTLYEVVSRLYWRLPSHMLTKASLTTLRSALTSRASLAVMFNKYKKPDLGDLELAEPDSWYALVGALSELSIQEHFFETTLDTVLQDICARASEMPSILPPRDLRKRKDKITILADLIHASETEKRNGASMKRPRHSDQEPPFATTSDATHASPVSKPDMKKFKAYATLSDLTSNLDFTVPELDAAADEGAQASDSAASGYKSESILSNTLTSKTSGLRETQGSVGFDDSENLSEIKTGPGHVQVSGEPSGTELDGADKQKEDAGDSGELKDGHAEETAQKPQMEEEAEDAPDPTKYETYLQNVILVTPFEAEFNALPGFPDVSTHLWSVVRGPIAGRDPLETHGDAAVKVVFAELLLEFLSTLVPKARHTAIFKALSGPIQSNATFLHFLRSRGFFKLKSKELPKYPGNTFEIVCAAVLISQSRLVLKDWVRETFRPILRGAIAAALSYKPVRVAEDAARKAQTLERRVREDDDDGGKRKRFKRSDSPPPMKRPRQALQSLNIQDQPQSAPTTNPLVPKASNFDFKFPVPALGDPEPTAWHTPLLDPFFLLQEPMLAGIPLPPAIDPPPKADAQAEGVANKLVEGEGDAATAIGKS